MADDKGASSMRRRFWAAILLAGVLLLVLGFDVLNIAYDSFISALSHTTRPNQVVGDNSTFYTLLAPSIVLGIVGLLLFLTGAVGLLDTWLRVPET